ncbi:MAG: DUF2946 family protein [Burkholderiales bacterium]
MKSARLIIVWLLMLALPLQAIAAFAPSAACGDDHAPQAQGLGGHGHQGMNHAGMHAASGHQHQDENQPADQTGTHSCCHHLFSGVPSAAIPGTPAPPHAVIQRIPLLHTLHIPELPQRPPRA